MDREELQEEIKKTKIIIDYLKEQKSYLEIASAIIRADMPDNEDNNVPIVKNRLGQIYEEN